MSSCCPDARNDLRESLVDNDSLQGIAINSSSYGSSQENNRRILPSFPISAPLLNPNGHLSVEIMEVLELCFNDHSGGLLFMSRHDLVRYFKRCYPGLSAEKYYEDRADYWLQRWGQPLKEVVEQMEVVVTDSKTTELVGTYSSNRRRRDDDSKEHESSLSKGHQIVVEVETAKVVKSIASGQAGDGDEVVLYFVRFLLQYRKAAVDKPMMVRLELTELGHEQFRSGMVMDRTKQLDKLAFNIQQLRNRHSTHLEEKKRIENAASPKQCSVDIESFIKSNQEPLDMDNDQSNLFRRRRPIKFPRMCHSCCCCCVCLIRAFE